MFKLLSWTRLLSCCQDEDEDKILDSLVSGQGDDELFQERERFGLTALEALSAEESHVLIRKKVIKLLSRQDEDKILDSLVSGQGDDGFFQERERFGLTALEALSAKESQVINRNKVVKLLSRHRWRQNSGLFGVWPGRWWTFSRKRTIWSNCTWSPISWRIPSYYQEEGY